MINFIDLFNDFDKVGLFNLQLVIPPIIDFRIKVYYPSCLFEPETSFGAEQEFRSDSKWIH